MELSKKLQVPDDTGVFVTNAPENMRKKLDLKLLTKYEVGAPVLLFAKNAADVQKLGKPAVDSAKADHLSWIAYPKAGKLDTDLNRDKLVELLREKGIEGVRLVSIDETWSAMRFRPVRPS
jgi:hypothetical protein